MALALFIHEWMQAAFEAVDDPSELRFVVVFQQLGREILLHLEDSAQQSKVQARVNHAMIAMLTRVVPGILSESTEGDMHQVRFRFVRPLVESGEVARTSHFEANAWTW